MTGLAPLSANPAKFVHLSVEQGLSQSSVQAVVQDHTGFMWFGTDEGLNRFDGYRFVVFKHDDKRADSLPDDSISALFEDSRQRLWIGTQHGLCRFDETTLGFKPIDQIHDRITGIVESADGTLWMASQGGGHFLLPPGESSFVSYVPDARYPWDSLSSYSLSAIYLDHQGRLWLGSRDHGVDRFVPGKPYGKFIHYRHGERDPASLSSNDVWGITENARGQIMVATYGAGLNLLDEKTSTFQKVRAPAAALPAANRLTAAFHDRAGAVWLGSDGAGLLRYDAQTGGLASAGGAEAESDPLHQTVVRSLYEDRQGHLWFGTYQMGVNQLKVPRRDFGYYTHEAADPASLSDPSVASVLQDRAGRIWVGTERGGLDQFDPVTGKFIRHRFPAPASSVPAIMSLHQDQEGRLWAGTYGEGLARFDPVSGNFTHFGKEAGLANQEVWTMADGPHGTLWLGTDGGLDQFDPQLGKVVSHFGPGSGGNLGDLSVRSLRTDAEGTLWVGSFGGLTALPSGAKELRHFQHDPRDPDSLSNDIVVAIYPDSRGNVWVGTLGGGMEKLNRANGRFTRFQNFPSHAINAIEADLQGKLWLSTNHGLVRFDPATGTASSFDLTNGLQSLQFHLGAGGHLRDGRLMFGSVDGLYLFDPAQIKPDRFAPPLVITAVKVLNKPVALRPASAAASAVVLPAADKLLSVEFAALDYSLPRRNQYAYRLEGLTGEWIELHDQREVSFTNLAAGSYLLRLRASNSDGVWSDASVASLAVTVLPPFWATWWFRGAVAAAVFGLFWGAHGLRVSSLRHALAVRKESEQVLRRAEEKYRELVEDIGDVIFSTNESGLVTYISPVVEGILGFAPAEIIGQSFAVLIGEGGLAQILQELKRPAHRARAPFEQEVRARDGEMHSVRISTRPIHEENELVGLRGVLTDVTEFKRLEQHLRQAQKMDAIGQLAGGIAHDFNNLLTAIMGFAELLRNRPLSAEARRTSLDEIVKAAERAAGLTQQLLAFSRQQQLEPQVLDLNLLLSEMDKMLQRLIGDDILLALSLDRSLGRVRADPSQIQQIILNLVVNARDAMPQGGRVLVQTANQTNAESGAESVVLTVSDNGVGMTPEVRARIFEPFFTTKEIGKGTGLGLSTVYGIVRQSGGRIEVATTLGQGSTFTVFLPRSIALSARIKEDPLPAPVLPAPLLPPAALLRGIGTVLVVDDNESVAKIAVEILQNAGAEVLVAGDAAEALAICDRQEVQIGLLVTDVVMPGLNGLQLAEELQKRFPAMRVLFISGYANDIIDAGSGDLSGHSFLRKPFQEDALLRKVASVIKA